MLNFEIGNAPGKQWNVLEVTEKSTGKRIKIKDYRFDPVLHSDAKTLVTGVINIKSEKAPVLLGVQPKPVEPEPVKTISAEERFASLKARGFVNLKGPEKTLYKELKKQLGQ